MHSTRTLFLLLLLLLPPMQSSAAEALGRLFFSATERAQLDRRQQEDHPALPPPSLDGIITRSAGTPTLFLDGKAARAQPGQMKADTKASTTTKAAAMTATISLP